MAVVVVLRRGVVALPSGASKASSSASRVLRTIRVSIGPPRPRRGHARPADRRIELAAGGQHGVADLLGIEPLDGPFPEQAVFGIDPLAQGEIARAALGRLAIGRRGQDQPVQRLELPAARDEFGRQPVEQLGVAGGLAQPAEVARRADQAAAEMVLPDPVDDDAGRQRIVGPAQPASQGQPPPGGLRAPRATARFAPASGRGPTEIPARSAPACGRRESSVGGETGPTSVAVSTGAGGAGRMASKRLRAAFCSSSHRALTAPLSCDGTWSCS